MAACPSIWNAWTRESRIEICNFSVQLQFSAKQSHGNCCRCIHTLRRTCQIQSFLSFSYRTKKRGFRGCSNPEPPRAKVSLQRLRNECRQSFSLNNLKGAPFWANIWLCRVKKRWRRCFPKSTIARGLTTELGLPSNESINRIFGSHQFQSNYNARYLIIATLHPPVRLSMSFFWCHTTILVMEKQPGFYTWCMPPKLQQLSCLRLLIKGSTQCFPKSIIASSWTTELGLPIFVSIGRIFGSQQFWTNHSAKYFFFATLYPTELACL